MLFVLKYNVYDFMNQTQVLDKLFWVCVNFDDQWKLSIIHYFAVLRAKLLTIFATCIYSKD